MRLMSILALCLVFTGCVSSGRAVNERQLSQIVSGQTTAADLVRIIGEPTSRTYREDGSQIMAWGYARIGMFFGAGTKVQSVSMIIGPDGTVSGYSRAGSKAVVDAPLRKAEPSKPPAPAHASDTGDAPLSLKEYQDIQIQNLMQEKVSYEEYQRRYKAIMAQ